MFSSELLIQQANLQNMVFTKHFLVLYSHNDHTIA